MEPDKLKYFLRSLARLNSNSFCPYCGSANHKTIDRKYFVTKLLECKNCGLRYRFPKDSDAFNLNFYNNSYSQKDGITTDLPNEETLNKWINTGFQDSPKDASEHISILKILFKDLTDIRILDFGANWGYSSFQFKRLGMDVTSFEISKLRAAYGRKLGIEIVTNEMELNKEVDIFYSSHVIEHLSSIESMIELSKSILRKGGFFVAFCPNGSEDFKKSNPSKYHKSWGMVHPNSITSTFYSKIFNEEKYYIGSNPYDIEQINSWSENSSSFVSSLQGSELMVIVKY